MYDILGNRRVTEEFLRTTLCLVEQSLNARPITAVSSNPLDLEALTSKHFILGQHWPFLQLALSYAVFVADVTDVTDVNNKKVC